jgi:hypothetical protein
MAKVDDNVLTRGLSGSLGQLVFRRYGSKTIVSLKPKRSIRKQSTQQKAQRSNFAFATHYAKESLADPIMKLEYQAIAKERGTNPWAAAVADYLKPIAILDIQVGTDPSNKGVPIRICLNDPTKVKTMTLTIFNSKGQIIEAGEPMPGQNGGAYLYASSLDQSKLRRAIVRVEVTDRPGNVAVRECE